VTRTYIGLILINGRGAHVKLTVRIRNGLRPQTSDSAPTSGAHRKDNIPCTVQQWSYRSFNQSTFNM